jgi:hypothetical protein
MRGNSATQVSGESGPHKGSHLGRRGNQDFSKRRIESAKARANAAVAERALLDLEGIALPEPSFSGGALERLQSIYRDPRMPPELQIVAARAAAPYERAAFLPKPEPEKRTVINLDGLDDNERALLGRLMHKVLPRDGNAPPPTIEHAPMLAAPATIIPDQNNGVAEQRSTRNDVAEPEALEREAERLRAELVLAARFGRLK